MCTISTISNQLPEAYNVNSLNNIGSGYLQFPMEFFTNPFYETLSSNAKIFYTRLKGLLYISLKNGLVDSCGAIFCYSSTISAQKLCNVASFSKSTASRVFQELENFGLLSRNGKRVYLFPAVPVETERSNSQAAKNIDLDVPPPAEYENSSDKGSFVCEEEDNKIETKKSGPLAEKSHSVSNLKSELPKSENNINNLYINNISTTNKCQDDSYLYNKKISSDVVHTFSKSESESISDSNLENSKLFDKLRGIGIITKKCRELISTQDHNVLKRALNCLYTTLSRNSSIKNPAGYFIYMLRNMDFTDTDYKCFFDNNAAKKELHESQKSVLLKLGFSEIISGILINAVQKEESFNFTERKACSALGFDFNLIYEFLRTNDLTILS